MLLTPPNQELMETEKEIEGYRTYAKADFILNNVGKTCRDGSRYFQGQTYRIEKLKSTITISQHSRPDPIFVATYHQDDIGSLSVLSFDYQQEWQNKLNNIVRMLKEQSQQKQQLQRRGRSL